METKSRTKALSKRSRPKWVAGRKAIGFSTVQLEKVAKLVADSLRSNPMATMTTVMHEALDVLYKQKFPNE